MGLHYIMSTLRDRAILFFAVVSIMANHAGLYIGKANIARVKGLGYPYKVFEHLRAVMKPLGAEGQKPRRELMRQSLGSLMICPAFLLQRSSGPTLCKRVLSAWNVRKGTSWTKPRKFKAKVFALQEAHLHDRRSGEDGIGSHAEVCGLANRC